MTDPTVTEPEQLRPTQAPCPRCECCTEALCHRGQYDTAGCINHTRPSLASTVAGCPCSAATTRGTNAWRAEMSRITVHATENPMPKIAEITLRRISACDGFKRGDHMQPLYERGYIKDDDGVTRITSFGHRYLTARDETRNTTPVIVRTVDLATRTARVWIAKWHTDALATVLLDQLTTATGFAPEELHHWTLEAKANCIVNDPDDIVLTRIRIGHATPAARTEAGK